MPCATFEDAFAAVSEGQALYAMIPVENSVFGRVADVHHLIPESGLYIVGERFVPIRHQLLGLPHATLEDLTHVRSHPQALGQCRKLLRELGVVAVPLECDGTTDSLYPPYDRAGHRHMEYVNEHGCFDDMPLERIVADFARVYPPSLVAGNRDADFGADVAREVAGPAGHSAAE